MNRKQRRKAGNRRPVSTEAQIRRAPAPLPAAVPITDELRQRLDHLRDQPGLLLRQIDQLRRELDEVERRAVSTARRQGTTWAEIGSWLGIARQNAHRKFGP